MEAPIETEENLQDSLNSQMSTLELKTLAGLVVTSCLLHNEAIYLPAFNRSITKEFDGNNT